MQVAAIKGTRVTISPGLYMPNWRSSQNPGAWWARTKATLDGVENMTLDHTTGGATAGILFLNAYKCWVKNVKSLRANRNHVWLYQTARTVVRDTYFYGTQNALALSYGVESFMGSDNLIENNIFQRVTAPVLMGNSSGTVVGYNFFTDHYYNVASWMTTSIDAHDAGTGMNLFEGNEGNGFLEDNIHGSHNFATVFRNRRCFARGASAMTEKAATRKAALWVGLVFLLGAALGGVLGSMAYPSEATRSAPTFHDTATITMFDRSTRK